MGRFSTRGTYSGPPPSDPTAELMKLFTVPENQQDGLATILNYVQRKVGFTVGSTSTREFQDVLNAEFPDIVMYRPAGFSGQTSTAALTANEQALLDELLRSSSKNVLDRLPEDKAQQLKFLAGVAPRSQLVKSVIEFISQMDSRDLTMDIAEEHTLNSNGLEVVVTDRNAWEVNRMRMAERAEWLVDYLKLKDSMDEWNQRITGSV